MKKILSVILALILALSLLPISASAASEYTGQTAIGDYTISTAAQLVLLAETVNSGSNYSGCTFTLTNNIDLSSVCGEMLGNWIPIGKFSTGISAPFLGTFDGNFYLIKNLYINATTDCVGLFEYVGSSGIIKDLGLTDSTIKSAKRFVGGIISINEGKIERCFSSANMFSTHSPAPPPAKTQLGGIVGDNRGGIIQYCYNAGSIDGGARAQNVGGICGYNTGKVNYCYNRGMITAAVYGGIAGVNSGTITNCFILSGDTADSNATVCSTMENLLLELTVTTLFVADDSPNINAGYPILFWQSTGNASNIAPQISLATNLTSATVRLNESYSLALDKVFIDGDGDVLTYTVEIGNEEILLANESYSYTPYETGIYKLIFNASDGMAGSPAYTVTLLVVDDSALLTAISNVVTSGYYTVNDRFNGISISKKGFWTDMQSTLTIANMVNNDSEATQEQINISATNLTAAIAKLISTDNVNATLLYEATVLADAKIQSDYSVSSWSAMQTELNAANAMLDALYDDGNPTALNVAAYNADGSIDTSNSYQDEVDAQTAALTGAIKALDVLAEDYLILDADMAFNSIPLLANKLFNPDDMSASEYTDDSYSAFIDARTEALAFRAGHSVPTAGMGAKEAQAYINAYTSFWNACYKGLVPAGDIKVTLSIVDSYAVHKDDQTRDIAGNYGELTLNSGAITLGDALTQALGADYVIDTWTGRSETGGSIGVYINGVFMISPTTSTRNAPGSHNNLGIHLRDGDQVTYVLIALPTYPSMSGFPTSYKLNEVGGNVKYHWLTENDAKVTSLITESGQPFTLTAKAQVALPSIYTGRDYALKDAAVYVSGCFDSQGEALGAAATNDIGKVTASDGSFIHTLYAEGWYLLTVYDKNENGSLTNGSPIIIQVTPPGDAEAVKAVLKSELDDVYYAYVQEYYTADDWTSITSYYENGVNGIENAATIGEAAEAQRTAVKAIKVIQDGTIQENTSKLSSFRGILSRLSDNMSKLDKSIEHLIDGYSYIISSTYEGVTTETEYHVDGLIEVYEVLTDYQKSLLTGVEQAKYNSIVSTYNNGLPELEPYELNLVVRADTSEAEQALAEMTTYLQENGYCGVFPDKRNTHNTFFTQLRRPDFYFENTGDINAGSADGVDGKITDVKTNTSYPDRWVTLTFDPGYAFIDPDKIFGEQESLSGTGWSIDGSGMSHGNYKNYYELLENVVVRIEGEPYEIKSIEFDGTDDQALFYAHGMTMFKNDGQISNRSLRIPNAIYLFAMPYNDVSATITWGPVAGSAKEQIKTELTEIFNDYVRGDYISENWALLVSAYNDGLMAITAAESDADAQTAKNNAIVAMASVAIKDVTAPVTNERGTVMGKVKIIVENTTFTSPAGGDTPAWTGQLINGWYDLYDTDTMMTAVLHALDEAGCTWGSPGSDPYGIAYLSSIKTPPGCPNGTGRLGEFDGYPGAGWMANMNDWFTYFGLTDISYENGMLEDGDEVSIKFTTNLGVDLGGTWGNSNTTLKDLTVSTGELTPSFAVEEVSGGTYEYALVISGSSANVMVTPSASNKNFLVKTFLNEKVTDNSEGNSFYKRTEMIPVRVGDVIYIGDGEPAWPSMNKEESGGLGYTGTWYELHVISADNGADYVKQLVSALPSEDKITIKTYESYRKEIEYARTIYDVLNNSEKEKVTLTKLTVAEEKLTGFLEVQNAKTQLTAIPAVAAINQGNMSSVADQVLSAKEAYDVLTGTQKNYIALGDINKYNAAVNKLIELDAFGTGAVPDLIVLNQSSAEITVPETVNVGEDFRVRVMKYDGENNLIPAVGVEIIYYTAGNQKNPTKTGVLTDVNGEATINIADSGTFYVAAEGRDIIRTAGQSIEVGEGPVGLRAQVEAAIEGAAVYAIDNHYSMDWVAVGLARAGKPIPADYLSNVEQYIIDNIDEFDNKPTEYEKMTLGILAAGGDPMDIAGYNLIEKIYNGKLSKQGNNGIIFGLIALDAGEYQIPADAIWTRDKLIEALLNAECTNPGKDYGTGGWALSGSDGDPDMTGMALTALAPYNNADYPEVQAAINRAVNFLSATQKDNGGYASWGAAASESCAQVIMGLCTNGIDPTGEDFTKANGNVIEALLSLKTESGGFAHVSGSGANGMATEQALYALDQYIYYLDGQGSIYWWGDKNPVVMVDVDINQDGKVNVLDLTPIGQRFSEKGDPGWIKEDVNKDGEINVLDLILVGQQFN